MSIKVMTLVWDNFNRGGSEKLVMLALADWCNDLGGSLHPSISTVAKKTNVSEKQARRIMHKLIDDGYLSVVGNENGGDKGQSRKYQFDLNKILTPPMGGIPTPPAGVTPPMGATPPMGVLIPSHRCPFTPPMGGSLTTIEPSRTINIYYASDETSIMNGMNEQVVKDYLAVRKIKKAVKFSQTSFDGLIRESAKSGISVEQALRICCERNWISFSASWIQEKVTYAESITTAANTVFKDKYIAEQTAGFFSNIKEITDEAA